MIMGWQRLTGTVLFVLVVTERQWECIRSIPLVFIEVQYHREPQYAFSHATMDPRLRLITTPN